MPCHAVRSRTRFSESVRRDTRPGIALTPSCHSQYKRAVSARLAHPSKGSKEPMTSSRFVIAGVVASLAFHAACTDTESPRTSIPAGPPMIEQVVLTEAHDRHDRATRTMRRDLRVRHAARRSIPNMEHAVDVGGRDRPASPHRLRRAPRWATPSRRSSAARTSVSTARSPRCPIGATPDDIAKCSVAQGRAADHLPGDHACASASSTAAASSADDDREGRRRSACSTSTRTAPPTITASSRARSRMHVRHDRLCRPIPTRATGTRRVTSIRPRWAASRRSARRSCSSPSTGDADEPDLRAVVRRRRRRQAGQPGLRADWAAARTACSGNLDLCSQDVHAGRCQRVHVQDRAADARGRRRRTGTDRTQPLTLVANTPVDTNTLAAAVTMTQDGATFTASPSRCDRRWPVDGHASRRPPARGAANTMYTLTFATALKDTLRPAAARSQSSSPSPPALSA